MDFVLKVLPNCPIKNHPVDRNDHVESSHGEEVVGRPEEDTGILVLDDDEDDDHDHAEDGGSPGQPGAPVKALHPLVLGVDLGGDVETQVDDGDNEHWEDQR